MDRRIERRVHDYAPCEHAPGPTDPGRLPHVGSLPVARLPQRAERAAAARRSGGVHHPASNAHSFNDIKGGSTSFMTVHRHSAHPEPCRPITTSSSPLSSSTPISTTASTPERRARCRQAAGAPSTSPARVRTPTAMARSSRSKFGWCRVDLRTVTAPHAETAHRPRDVFEVPREVLATTGLRGVGDGVGTHGLRAAPQHRWPRDRLHHRRHAAVVVQLVTHTERGEQTGDHLGHQRLQQSPRRVRGRR